MSQDHSPAAPLIEFRFTDTEPVTEEVAQAALLAWMLPIIRRVATTTSVLESTAEARSNDKAA